MKKRRSKKIENTTFVKTVFGIIVSFLSLIAVSLVFSAILTGTKNPTGNLKTVSLAVFLIAGVLSGFFNSKRCGEGGMFVSILSSFAFIALMLVIALIIDKGNVGGMLFMNYLCYMMIATFGAFLGRKREKKHRRR